MWSEAACPADVLEAIPWYPDGLSAAQRGALEAHAADCAECRRELAFVRGAPAEAPVIDAEAERVWKRVLERIAAEDAQSSGSVVPLAPARPTRSALRPLALAASLALAVGLGALGAVGALRLAGGEEPVYRTATAAPEVSAAGPTLDVVFRKDATAREIDAKLREIGGGVVAGPSALGVYRIALAAGADAASAAAALRAESGGVATLAEPAHP